MATVVLQYAGGALGAMFGGPIGGIIGRAAGAIAGNILDQKLFGTKRHSEGPRLNDLRVMTSEEGAPIPRLWGRMRIAGQVIWATNYEEVSRTDTQKASGKGGGGGKAKTTTYTYFGNFAVGLCEGPIHRIGRVWADGKEIDISAYTTRLYTGTETQQPDSLIVAKEGADVAPAYRGLAYIVFERLPLESFGNRLPQLSFEVVGQGSGVENHIKAINIIPGSTEFGYDTELITRNAGPGVTEAENLHASSERSDWTVSIDQLTAGCSNFTSAAIVVSWFGTDLRVGTCEVKPGVENATKVTTPASWRVSGATRAAAHQVSQVNGGPAFGGTPSDDSVLHAIADLKARGLKPVFYPFILMDVPQGNSLPDPYGGAAQPVYPWRGRITCHPAPGRVGTVDKTAAAATQLDSFVGTAQASHFAVSEGAITYSGPAEWSYRRMILHYANLCALAGGVDAFIIGSELRGLTTLRSAAATYPFVNELMTLAAEVKAILPDAKVTYAADWTEYFGHQPADGSNDVYFHLDPLWASASIDAIGIDNYMPLTDWRDGASHADKLAGFTSPHDEDYLKSRIASGEGYDWYYASAADRDSQLRTPISDGAYGKPWVFRTKDIKSWWSNPHFNRPGGVESTTPTDFVPQSKPVWFTEAGCPAIDKGANQPNVFVDAKSSESALPYYSTGARDDVMQARYVAALDDYWSASGSHNPVSSLYGEPMVDASRIFFWCWDARPFPYFPARTDIWSDGVNYARGHWLNGRISAVMLTQLITQLCASYGVAVERFVGVDETVAGYVIDRPMTARAALESLLQAFTIDAVESDGQLAFVARKSATTIVLNGEDMVEIDPGTSPIALTRTQESELPSSLKFIFADADSDYRNAVAAAMRPASLSRRETIVELPCATTQSTAERRASVLLQESWSAREHISFALPPSLASLEAGDVIDLGSRLVRIEHIKDGAHRSVEARSYEPQLYLAPAAPERAASVGLAPVYGPADIAILDLPIVASTTPATPWMAATARPWPGSLAVLRQTGSATLGFNRLIETQATMGRTLTPLVAGPLHRFDRGTTLDIKLQFGALAAVSELEVLNGANIAAAGDEATGYEIIQFAAAQLIAPDTWRISTLLRAQAGSVPEMLATRPAGVRFVLLNGAMVQPDLSLAEALAPSTWRIGPAQFDQGHSSYLSLTSVPSGRALRPYRPAHLRCARSGGDLVFSWIRRTRTDGDSWDVAEVPLGESDERYSISISHGANLVRTTDVMTPSYVYTAASMAIDFAVPPATLTVAVAQISSVVGAGPITQETFNV